MIEGTNIVPILQKEDIAMNNFEFDGFDCSNNNSAATESSEKGSFWDFIDGYDCSDNKCMKRAKKALKSAKKQKKSLKKLSSKYRDLEKNVSAIRADINTLKKSAYANKIAELVNSDNITERKRLANELYKMEG